MNDSGALTRYSVAVSAALSLSSASGAIVYSGVLNATIDFGTSSKFDIDGDGFTDLEFSNFNYFGGPYQGVFTPYIPSKIVSFSVGLLTYAINLTPGVDTVSLESPFATAAAAASLAYGTNNPNALFNNANPGYIGLNFIGTGGATYNSWVRVTINNAAASFTVVDWAYENTGAAITVGAVPEPTVASLGLLAAGAAGLGIYRRRKAKQAA